MAYNPYDAPQSLGVNYQEQFNPDIAKVRQEGMLMNEARFEKSRAASDDFIERIGDLPLRQNQQDQMWVNQHLADTHQKLMDIVKTRYNGDYGAAAPELSQQMVSEANKWNKIKQASDLQKQIDDKTTKLEESGKLILPTDAGGNTYDPRQMSIFDKKGNIRVSDIQPTERQDREGWAEKNVSKALNERNTIGNIINKYGYLIEKSTGGVNPRAWSEIEKNPVLNNQINVATANFLDANKDVGVEFFGKKDMDWNMKDLTPEQFKFAKQYLMGIVENQVKYKQGDEWHEDKGIGTGETPTANFVGLTSSPAYPTNFVKEDIIPATDKSGNLSSENYVKTKWGTSLFNATEPFKDSDGRWQVKHIATALGIPSTTGEPSDKQKAQLNQLELEHGHLTQLVGDLRSEYPSDFKKDMSDKDVLAKWNDDRSRYSVAMDQMRILPEKETEAVGIPATLNPSGITATVSGQKVTSASDVNGVSEQLNLKPEQFRRALAEGLKNKQFRLMYNRDQGMYTTEMPVYKNFNDAKPEASTYEDEPAKNVNFIVDSQHMMAKQEFDKMKLAMQTGSEFSGNNRPSMQVGNVVVMYVGDRPDIVGQKNIGGYKNVENKPMFLAKDLSTGHQELIPWDGGSATNPNVSDILGLMETYNRGLLGQYMKK